MAVLPGNPLRTKEIDWGFINWTSKLKWRILNKNTVLRSVYTERQWVIWSVSINACLISDLLGWQPIFWRDSLGLLIKNSSSIDADYQYTRILRWISSFFITINNYSFRCFSSQFEFPALISTSYLIHYV